MIEEQNFTLQIVTKWGEVVDLVLQINLLIMYYTPRNCYLCGVDRVPKIKDYKTRVDFLHIILYWESKVAESDTRC